MSNTASFTEVRRIIADTVEELDGNAIVAPDGEVIGNSEITVEELHQALAFIDVLEHRFAPPPRVKADTEEDEEDDD